MKIEKISLVVILIALVTFSANAQKADGFTIGLGWSVIDNDDRPDVSFDIAEGWNYSLLPGRISLDKGVTKFLNMELVGSRTEFREGKFVEGRILPLGAGYTLYVVDLHAKVMLKALIGQKKLFDPYLLVGAGNSGRGSTYNFGFGFNTWFSDRVGLNFQTVGKRKIAPVTSPNYIQHSVGVVFKLSKPAEVQKSDALNHLKKIIKKN